MRDDCGDIPEKNSDSFPFCNYNTLKFEMIGKSI